MLVCEKSPLIFTGPTWNGVVPVFVKVTPWGALAVPTAWFTNVRLPVDICAVGLSPVPLRLTVCGEPGAELATDNVPVRAPACVGVK